jgi:hypothetical protein
MVSLTADPSGSSRPARRDSASVTSTLNRDSCRWYRVGGPRQIRPPLTVAPDALVPDKEDSVPAARRLRHCKPTISVNCGARPACTVVIRVRTPVFGSTANDETVFEG